MSSCINSASLSQNVADTTVVAVKWAANGGMQGHLTWAHMTHHIAASSKSWFTSWAKINNCMQLLSGWSE